MRQRKVTNSPVKVLRSEEHTSELQSQSNLVCRLLLEKKKQNKFDTRAQHPNRDPTARRLSPLPQSAPPFFHAEHHGASVRRLCVERDKTPQRMDQYHR